MNQGQARMDEEWVRICNFLKNIQKYETWTMRSSQRGRTITQKLSWERQCPYLLFGTLGFAVWPSVESQWPCENHDPPRAMAKMSNASISSRLLLGEYST